MWRISLTKSAQTIADIGAGVVEDRRALLNTTRALSRPVGPPLASLEHWLLVSGREAFRAAPAMSSPRTGRPDLRVLRWRYDTFMATCAWCGAPFAPSGRRRYDTDACRQASYRARHAALSAFEEPVRARPGATVYECPECETRYLGPERRCPDCNLFCRRIGPGGLCPHCEEPVAHRDLGS